MYQKYQNALKAIITALQNQGYKEDARTFYEPAYLAIGLFMTFITTLQYLEIHEKIGPSIYPL